MPKALSILLCLPLLFPWTVQGIGDSAAYFEKHIRPLLIKHCYECHSHESGKAKGGLQLDSREGWSEGGDSGPAITPGEPSHSLLLKAVSYKNTDLQMPPEKRLSSSDRDHLLEWIAQGAYDPREAPTSNSKPESNVVTSDFWSFRPIEKSQKPPKNNGGDWSHGPVDQFLAKEHQAEGIKPAPDADIHTALRRLWVVLTGLPPSPDQIDVFLNDDSVNAWERQTDRLLASPRYGEHWGRHWLDVTRFAESSGGGRSLMFKEAWRFRDYVIDAFNEDIPHNDLIREHLAGDILFQQDPLNAPRQSERLVATGFLALTARAARRPDTAQPADRAVLAQGLVAAAGHHQTTIRRDARGHARRRRQRRQPSGGRRRVREGVRLVALLRRGAAGRHARFLPPLAARVRGLRDPPSRRRRWPGGAWPGAGAATAP